MTVKEMLEQAFDKLRLKTAGREDDVRRWSATDLANDLAPFVERFIVDTAMNPGKASSRTP